MTRRLPLLLFLAALPLPAPTLRVPTEYPTIPSAGDKAKEGDTIVVSPGIYREQVNLRGPNITLRSENPGDHQIVASTVIKRSTIVTEMSRGIQLTGTEGEETRILGLTFQDFIVAISGRDSSPAIVHCHFVDNHSGIAQVNGLIRDCVFRSNTSAISVCEGNIKNNIVIGKGRELLERSEMVSSCLGNIEGNLIAFGVNGGVFNCSGTILNNTIYGNRYVNISNDPRARPYGGGITSCTGTIRNNVVWGNTVDGEPVQIVDSSTPEYCCIQGWTGGGVGNNFTDPRFVSPDTTDFRLQTNSFCIDSGGLVSDSTTDLDGTARGFVATDEQRGDGSHIDIGAYEFTDSVSSNSPPGQPMNLSPLDGTEGVSLGPLLESSEYADSDEGDVHSASRWQADEDSDFGSPELDTGLDVKHLTTLRAFGGALAPSTEYYWRVRHMDNRYSWGEWSEPTRMTLEDFDALFVPMDFPTIQAAADGVSEGDLVIVRGGTYRENVVFPGTNFHLRSVDPNDPEVVEGTVIQGVPVPGETYYSVLTFNGTETPDFVLEGLTIAGAFGDEGGGVVGNENQATFRGNSFRNNAAFRGGAMFDCDGLILENRFQFNSAQAAGAALYECDGSIEKNLFSNNEAGVGAAAALSGYRSKFRNNVVRNNRAGEGGAFYRCNGEFLNNLIYLNTALGAGNSFYGCDAYILNNTLYENGRGIGSFFECRRATILNNIILDRDGLYNSADPDYCLLYSPLSVGGDGNFLADPRFVDADNGDFRLRGDSPCIDAGGKYTSVRNTDFDGNPRPVKGVNFERGDGTLADIGAFEFQIFANPGSDVRLDTQVNFLDLFQFQSGWDRTVPSSQIDRRDVDRDKEIDSDDLLILLNDWGVTTGP